MYRDNRRRRAQLLRQQLAEHPGDNELILMIKEAQLQDTNIEQVGYMHMTISLPLRNKKKQRSLFFPYFFVRKYTSCELYMQYNFFPS